MVETLISIITGGGLGFLGTVATGVLEYFKRKQDLAHELAIIKAESDAVIQEAEANIKVVRAEVEGKIEVAEAAAFDTSQAVGNASVFKESYMEKMFNRGGWWLWWGMTLCFFMGMVDVLRAACRPALTIYHVIATTWIASLAYQVMTGKGLTIEATYAQDLFSNIILTVLFLTTTSVTWWFGDRRIGKVLEKIYTGPR
nr:hypothetical protein 14 [bacterium]